MRRSMLSWNVAEHLDEFSLPKHANPISSASDFKALVVSNARSKVFDAKHSDTNATLLCHFNADSQIAVTSHENCITDCMVRR